MGDVFDAMNRAEKERGGQSKSSVPAASDAADVPEGGQAAVDVPADEDGEKELPSLPIGQVQINLSEQDDDEPLLCVDDMGGTTSQETDRDDRAVDGAPVDQGWSRRPETPNGYSDKLIVHHDKGSVVTEQYRAIRTQILARARNRRLQIHVITSSVPEEGKSVTTTNLGVVFSELRNKKILVIEGDLRRPSFQKLFGRQCTPGLLQLLRGDLNNDQEAIHTTIYDNLHFVPAGGRDATHCTELLSSPRMTQILERFRGRYDHIFIDTPPVVSVTDAAILAAMGDQALLVVRLHKTPVEMVDRAKRLLRANNCNVSGVILTHMKMIFMPGYMSRYSYGSAYA